MMYSVRAYGNVCARIPRDMISLHRHQGSQVTPADPAAKFSRRQNTPRQTHGSFYTSNTLSNAFGGRARQAKRDIAKSNQALHIRMRCILSLGMQESGEHIIGADDGVRRLLSQHIPPSRGYDKGRDVRHHRMSLSFGVICRVGAMGCIPSSERSPERR